MGRFGKAMPLATAITLDSLCALHTEAFCTRSSFRVVELHVDRCVVLGSAEAAVLMFGGVVADVFAWPVAFATTATPSSTPIHKTCGPVNRSVPVLDPTGVEFIPGTATQGQELVRGTA